MYCFCFFLFFVFFVCCSSPHLMEVRERIRINGKPLAKDKFAKYFFDCWDNLHNNVDVSGQELLSAVHIIIQAYTHLSCHLLLEGSYLVHFYEIYFWKVHYTLNIQQGILFFLVHIIS